MYGYRCEYCPGTVRPHAVEREVFRHARGFVILEEVTVGVCDGCAHRYYTAEVLRQVDGIATGQLAAERTEAVPVSRARIVQTS